ncbi:unnamed protein product [Thelazia callipaeda]|uniref:DUF7753 domain-containing protein n=1 Tax=Thelazia callipaeda TaxID=103827 RepID=A0A0N5D673_THECL|nr:unnamed protein product [Thelazia callipaeda]
MLLLLWTVSVATDTIAFPCIKFRITCKNSTSFTLWFLLLPILHEVIVLANSQEQAFDCDILDAKCRERYRQTIHTTSIKSKASRCSQQDIWLIPGKADASCSRPGAKKVLEVDPRQLVIRPEVVKLPGCFDLEIKNVRVLDNEDAFENSFFAKAEYQWWNVKDFANLKCQNASNNGCGGYGNNCYYCDICKSLTELQTDSSKSTLANQLKGINCPSRPGFYTFRKEFCFNDWSAFDRDGDCQFDFFQGDKFSDYRSALSYLQQIGYGTLVAKLRLAMNATGDVEEKKRIKEASIEENIQKELEERRKSWDINNGQFEKFRQWYINYRKDIWHREDYLPWLLYENEISCIRLTFDVCERIPRRSPFTGQLTCNPN